MKMFLFGLSLPILMVIPCVCNQNRCCKLSVVWKDLLILNGKLEVDTFLYKIPFLHSII